MMSTIFNDKMITFPSDCVNGLKAATELDGLSYTYVRVFDSNVLVTFVSENDTEYAKEKELMTKAKAILNKYCIPYKIRKF